ncbi:transposase IS4 family protein [Streptomyces sp. PVA_94-07]|nr:transposase IS4 family protein [Streptomyces sp. PVA_94-07]
MGDRLQASSPLVGGRNLADAAAEGAVRRGRSRPDRLGRVRGLHGGACPPARRRGKEDGARRRSSKGGAPADEPGRSGDPETDRPAGGGGQIGEYLGRSHGGFTTKIHVAADGRCRPLALLLTPGHYGDGPQLQPVLEQVSVPRAGVGRPRTRPDPVLADKAYTSRRNRRYLRRRGISHTIPDGSTSADSARTAVPAAAGPPGSTASATSSATPSSVPSTA